MKQMSYAKLDARLYTKCSPEKPEQAEMVVYNEKLSRKLGIDFSNENMSKLTEIFSGQIPFDDTSPIAQAYAGHQFGHFTILGDGRAHLINEIEMSEENTVDCMLKGSGKTPYSRGGDGLAALGPMLREYIISQAMDSLLIPTSKSLAVVSTNRKVYREKPLRGAVLTRIAASHIRVGTFQYVATLGDVDALRQLADYTIERHYRKELEEKSRDKESEYLLFFREVLQRQARLIAKWLSVGFIHGVMNTDNMAISGETIDYGPCAFMNTYDINTVFSSIDTGGRYSYKNQPHAAKYNLARLGQTLIPLICDDQEKATEEIAGVLEEFDRAFSDAYANIMGEKLGFKKPREGDDRIIGRLLRWMEEYKADFTDTFRDLTLGEAGKLPFYKDPDFKSWHSRLKQRQLEHYPGKEQIERAMKSCNPAFIPRNHLVEKALHSASEDLSMDSFNKLLEMVSIPYAYSKDQLDYKPPSEGYDKNYKTFCGT